MGIQTQKRRIRQRYLRQIRRAGCRPLWKTGELDPRSLANTMMVDVTMIDLEGRISWCLTTGSTPSLKRMIVPHEAQADLYDHRLVCGAKLSLLKKPKRSELAPKLWAATTDLSRQ